MTGDIAIDAQNNQWISSLHRFKHEAMATVFEIFIHHADKEYAEQAAYAAFDECGRLENELSRYIENSDVSRINHLPANTPTRVSLETFECLQQCQKLYQETNGAFDITIGLLYRCWVNQDKSQRNPAQDELDFARRHTGMNRIELNEDQHTVLLKTAPLSIDLGGFGKGCAVDKMGELLREWDTGTALIHGGWSTVLALDSPSNTGGWPVAVRHPVSRETIRIFSLQNNALSGSGLRKGHHIIDPRTGRPARAARAAWSAANTAAYADALSTAFIIMSPKEIENFCMKHTEMKAIVIDGSEDGSIKSFE